MENSTWDRLLAKMEMGVEDHSPLCSREDKLMINTILISSKME